MQRAKMTKTFLKKKVEGLTLPAIKTHSKATIMLENQFEDRKKQSYGTEESPGIPSHTYMDLGQDL